MTEWKYLFRPVILARGKEYHDAGKVIDFKKENNVIKAAVEGEYPYSVQIVYFKEQISDMYCNCPHCLKGERCKHMVASLLEAEKQQDNNS